MAGRRAKPVQLHLCEGNPSHLTKEEIATRLQGEIRLGDLNFKMPTLVRKNTHARKKWKEVVGIYLEFQATFASTSDAAVIERYCLTYAEYMGLQEVRAAIHDMALDKIGTYRAAEQINLESSINKKAEMLNKLEDRLLLNPLAKIRNVPKKPQVNPEPTELEKMGLGGL